MGFVCGFEFGAEFVGFVVLSFVKGEKSLFYDKQTPTYTFNLKKPKFQGAKP